MAKFIVSGKAEFKCDDRFCKGHSIQFHIDVEAETHLGAMTEATQRFLDEHNFERTNVTFTRLHSKVA